MGIQSNTKVKYFDSKLENKVLKEKVQELECKVEYWKNQYFCLYKIFDEFKQVLKK